MGKLIYIMGKSSSGKDTIYEEIRSREELNLRPFIMYTTRPIRAKETDGVEYHFVSIEKMQQMQADGKVIEMRSYDTVHGIWYYFTHSNISCISTEGLNEYCVSCNISYKI